MSTKRNIDLHKSSMSNNITGHIFVRNEIVLKTMSGTIDVKISPDFDTPSKSPPPIKVHLQSMSGTVRVDLSDLEELIGRVDEVHVGSMSGNITGVVVSGRRTKIWNGSGSIDIDLLLGAQTNMDQATVRTSSANGSQTIRARSLGAAIGNYSTHETRCGIMNISYPQDWNGTVAAESKTGYIQFLGSAFSVDLRDDRRVLGSRGCPAGAGASINGPNSVPNILRVECPDGRASIDMNETLGGRAV